MTQKHVRAKTAKAAKRKADGPKITVTKVNYIPGTKAKGMKTYAVTTKKKKQVAGKPAIIYKKRRNEKW